MARLKGSDGYITLAVLVVGGLLATLVTMLLSIARPAMGLTRIGADEVAVGGLLEGGLEATGYLLFKAEQQAKSVNGTEFRLPTGSVRVTVADEGARIDLNAASQEFLAGLYEEVKATSLEPEAFAARVVDWRDRNDDATRGGGAEAFDYRSAGVDQMPRNDPFRSVGELRLVLGLSAEDFARLEPYVTVFSQASTVNALTASKTVLSAVPGITDSEVTDIIAAQAAASDQNNVMANLIDSYGEFLSTEPKQVYRVGLSARLSAGYAANAEAVVAAAEDEQSDFGVVRWSRLAPSPPPR
jgi:hypothetical protein